MNPNGKSVAVAYFFWLFSFALICGLQHFYMRKYLRGTVWLFTLGLLGVGVLVDLFTIPRQIRNLR